MSGKSALTYSSAPGQELQREDDFVGWQQPGQPIDRPIARYAQYNAPRSYPPPPKKQPRPAHDADVVYCYDGSFAGFLCCIFESFNRHEMPFSIWPPEQTQPTLYETRFIDSDQTKAKRVYKSYCNLMGSTGRRLLNTVFLSGDPDKELLLLRFMRIAFSEGQRTLGMVSHPDVAAVYALDTAIGYEIDHLQGFVRFQDADGMLGSIIHPKCHALPLLRGHFCTRFPDEQFLIYDATHSEVLLYQNHQAQLFTLDTPLTLPEPDETEQYYQDLWKQFYHTLSIEARRNEALRRTHCAKRFWADMTELKDQL